MKDCPTEVYLERISIGLSHDINNVFTYILGMAELGKLQQQDSFTNNECFDKIISYVERGKNLTHHVMDFGNSFRCQKNEFSLPEFLLNFTSNFEQKMFNGNKIILTVSDDIELVHADKVLLNKLFFYLFENASESYLHAEHSEKLIECNVVRLSPYLIECTVKDHGVGLPDDHECDLFTPFFTTKKAIQHAGMGLTIAQQVVLAHEGEIAICNNANSIGATVKFKLPILPL